MLLSQYSKRGGIAQGYDVFVIGISVQEDGPQLQEQQANRQGC